MTFGGEHVEVGRIVAPVAKIFFGLGGLIAFVVSITMAYSGIVNRIDRIDERMVQQGESLKVVADAVKQLASDALTVADLRNACLEMALANTKRGWTCPLAVTAETAPITETRRTASKRKAAPPDAIPGILFGQ